MTIRYEEFPKNVKIATEKRQIVKQPYPITIVFFYPKSLVGTNEN